MMHRFSYLFCGLALVFALSGGAIAAESCPQPATQPYAGPLIDAMAQIESTETPEKVLGAMRAAGVNKMALFARLHRRRSGENAVLQAMKLAPNQIIAGAPKSFDEHDDLGSGFVSRTLAGIAANRYAFVGEIMFTHGDKTHGEQTTGGERYVDPLGAGVQRLLGELKSRAIPVMTHWEVYDWERDWPRVSELYRRYPDQKFIWPHAGFASVNQIDAVLLKHANVVATLSKKEQDQRALSDHAKAAQLGSALIDGCNVLRPEWKALLVRHQDRLLFATDAHKDFRWRNYGEIAKTWRDILGQLPPEAADKIAYQNANRIYSVRN